MLRKITAYLLLVGLGLSVFIVNAFDDSERNRQLKEMSQQAVLTVLLDGCSFKFNNYYKGWTGGNRPDLSEKSNYYLGDNPVWGSYTFGISFECKKIDELKAEFAAQEWPYSAYAPKQDEATGQWVVKPIALSKEEEKRLRNEEWSWVQIAALKKSQSGGHLKAVNADGFYVLNNEIIGDEARRTVSFMGCLMRPPHALCASVPQVGAVAEPKKRLTPYVLKLLESIEFLPDSRPAASDIREVPQ